MIAAVYALVRKAATLLVGPGRRAGGVLVDRAVSEGERPAAPDAPRPTRYDRYLDLADDVSATGAGVFEAISQALAKQERQLTFRERVLAGLALKIDGAFAALIDDTRAYRSESMHHLKTMAEAFIYFQHVATDESDRPAEIVVAEAYNLRAEMLEQDGQRPEDVAQARRSRDELLRGERLPRRRDLRSLATQLGLDTWYWRVYKAACQPAHLGDLVDFMPADHGTLEVGGSVEAAVQGASSAVHFGISLMLQMLTSFNAQNLLGLHVRFDELRERFAAIASE